MNKQNQEKATEHKLSFNLQYKTKSISFSTSFRRNVT